MQYAFFIVLLSFAANSMACEYDKNTMSIDTKDGVIFVCEDEIETNHTPGPFDVMDKEVALSLMYKKNGGESYLIKELPYLADTGKVSDIIFNDIDADQEKEIIVIHQVEIRAHTEVSYSSDHYTVQVFKKGSAGRYIYDKKLSNFFGSGADIIDSDTDEDLYVFPFKRRVSILNATKSAVYRALVANQAIQGEATAKIYFHELPNISFKQKLYIIKGDKFETEGFNAGWLLIRYTAKNGHVYSGWVDSSKTNLAINK